MKIQSYSVVLASLVGLTACGGGGGGSSTLSAFTNWSSVSPSSSIVVSGDSYQGTYSYNVATSTVTGLTSGSHQSGASYTGTYDAGGSLTAATINSATGTSVSWSRAAGDTFGTLIIDSRVDAFVSANGQNYALAANPTRFGFEYQTFGTWVTGGGTGSGTYGFISVGNPSSGSSVPTTGTATYTGVTGGRYIDSTGIDYFITSSLSVTADFTARNLLFSTNGTAITRDLITSSSATNLNLTGSLSYTAGSATFSGSLSTTGLGTRGNPLQGQAYGRFYGPSAQEIGGTFAVSSGFSEGAVDKEIYGGAFGARR
jgi:hypothetical protein